MVNQVAFIMLLGLFGWKIALLCIASGIVVAIVSGNIIGKVRPYMLVGIAIGGFMRGYAPADFLVTYAGPSVWHAVPLAALIGVPLYSNASGVIPIVKVLMEKGMAIYF